MFVLMQKLHSCSFCRHSVGLGWRAKPEELQAE